MRSKLQQFGLIALGVCLGVMISLNFSAVAQREVLGRCGRGTARVHEVFGRITSDYVETVEDKKLITDDYRHARRSTRTPLISTRRVPRIAGRTQGEFGGLGIEFA